MNTVCASCQALNRIPDDRSADGAKCGRCGHDLFDGDVINATGATLDKLLKDDLPVVVDFWAPWCGPCRMMTPVIAQAARELGTVLRVAKLNTEESQAVAARYGIRSIPTLAVFRGGQEVARQSGAVNYATLIDWLKSVKAI
mgnify:CR=1 FL=1